MKILLKHGRNILETEVTNVSNHGMWILSQGKELFLSYEQFPWFKDKTINNITKIESYGQGILHWPELDVDLSLEIIEHPERFPLQSKIPNNQDHNNQGQSKINSNLVLEPT
jgi:hypothetical protein